MNGMDSSLNMYISSVEAPIIIFMEIGKSQSPSKEPRLFRNTSASSQFNLL